MNDLTGFDSNAVCGEFKRFSADIGNVATNVIGIGEEAPRARLANRVAITGTVICRQPPSPAKGHVIVSPEDETGISNAIVRSDSLKNYT